MGRPRFHPTRNALAAMVVAAATSFAIAVPAGATPWQKAWGDYDNSQHWHDAGWWLENRPDWVTSHHPEWTENYATTRGQIGDSDGLHVRHYGDGGLDRIAAAAAIQPVKNETRKARGTSSNKTEASIRSARES
jgi:hypothetical protein